MNNVAFVSGGEASHWAATIVADRYGADDLHLVFTDVITEDADNYRLILESARRTLGTDHPNFWQQAMGVVQSLPEVDSYESLGVRKRLLPAAKRYAEAAMPNLHWIQTTYDRYKRPGPHSIVDVWFEERRLGSQQADNCSKYLKREPAKRFVHDHFSPDDTRLYLGLDGGIDADRHGGPWSHWQPYEVQYPLTWDSVDTRIQGSKAYRLDKLESEHGIEPPRLYAMNHSHSNCSGFCVRQGVGDHRKLLDQRPDYYDFLVQVERDVNETIWLNRAANRHNSLFGTSHDVTSLRAVYQMRGREVPRTEYTFARESSLAARLDHLELDRDEVERRRVQYTNEMGNESTKPAYCRKDTGERLPSTVPLSLKEIRRREKTDQLDLLGDDRLGCGGCFVNYGERSQ